MENGWLQEAVDECRFDDLGYMGLPYTWDNRQQDNDNIKVRLDRGLGDDKFQEDFDNTTIQHVQTTESDHCALIISVQKSDWVGHERRFKPFHFENAWTRHENYDKVVDTAWVPRIGSLLDVQESFSRVK